MILGPSRRIGEPWALPETVGAVRHPPCGFLFTTRGGSLPAQISAFGQRVAGWLPEDLEDEASHAGIVGRDGWVWEADWLRGVTCRPLGLRPNLRLWHPPEEERLEREDYRRAFSALRALRGRPYDWRWIVSLGLMGDDRRLICTELVNAYLDALTQRVGGWPGMAIRRLSPNHLSRLLREATGGRRSG